jgi:regulator of sigma E protease
VVTVSSLAIYVLAFAFVLGVLIFIHELGHFLMARFFGIGVHVFSLGFGKRLVGFRRGDTDYRISMIPLGGYVKMAGENPDEELTGSAEEFLSRPKMQRFWVAIAGPVMNLALAVILLTATLMTAQEVLEYLGHSATIGSVGPDSPARLAGLRAGDTIVSVDGTKTPTWKEAALRIAINPNRTLDIEFVRDGAEMRTSVATGGAPDGRGVIGADAFHPFLVRDVITDSAAEEAGIRKGDEIIAVYDNGKRHQGFFAIKQVVEASQGAPLRFEIGRDGEVTFQTIAPRITEEGLRLGASLDYKTRVQQLGAVEAFRQSLGQNYEMAVLTFVTLGRLVTGNSSVKQLSGPIEIAKFSGQAAILGLVPLLSLMAVISLQLGLLNLLPIPILDGGMIALLAIEGLMGRDLSLKMKERMFKVGFVFIVLLMGVVLFNDLAKNLSGF